jgi:prepilin-type N-terminal cleavage/methylation domain-containing protein
MKPEIRFISSSHGRRRRGVTLVEVLATLVLVGIVLPVAMRGITMSMQAASRARHLTEATMLAESKLNELAVTASSMGLTAGTGDFGADWPEYQWESEWVAREYGVYELTVGVSWVERGLARSTSISTLVYPDATTEIETVEY